jgi:dienelactone hydrolase
VTSTSDRSVYDYEPSAAPTLRERGRQTVRDASVRDVVFTSPTRGDVSAYLVVPTGDGPFPAVVCLHSGMADRTEFLSDALLLAEAGATSLLLDAPHVRPGWTPVAFGMDPEGERDFLIQVVVELRRAVDELVALDSVDDDRVAYVGHSLGATVAGAFAALEPRVRPFVLMGGVGLPPVHPGAGAEMARSYEDLFSSISSSALIGEAPPGSVYFQFARFDRHVGEPQAQAYAEAACEPGAVAWYDTSHEFNDSESRRDRMEWIATGLGLDRVPGRA